MPQSVTALSTAGVPGRRYPANPPVFGFVFREFAERTADIIFVDPTYNRLRSLYSVIDQFAQVMDVGVAIIVQMVKQSDGSPLDISAASALSIILGFPGGVRETKAALQYTDGIDGKMYYVVEIDVFDIPGDYFVQGKVVVGADTFYSEVKQFTVLDNIEPADGPTPPDPHVGTFIVADLVNGILTITHNEGLTPPYTIAVTIFDNTGHEIIPDTIIGSENTVAIDLTSFLPILGTYGYVYI